MIQDVNKQLLERADSLYKLATMICGYGYYAYHKDDRDHPIPKEAIREYLEMGVVFQQGHSWHKADGDELPDIDREVIALTTDSKVVFAHRPAESWKGKNLDTGEVTTYYPKRYDAGGWNQPDVKWWLDIQLPEIDR